MCRRFIGKVFSLDPVIAMNLAFDLIILSLSAYVYMKKRGTLPIWITAAFCFFPASHVISILEFGGTLILIPLRAIGYLSIVAGVVLHSMQL